MTSVDNQLFTVEEALSRLGQNKEQGCLLVSKGNELVTIYVQNGFVLGATSGLKTGKDAVDHALHMVDASYQWIRGIQPPDAGRSIYINIQEFVLTNGNINKDKIIETGKVHFRPEETASEAKYSYFLVPQDQPTVKLFLTKKATVLGRNSSSDLVIDAFNISGRHCILDIRNRGLFILDLDSTNGTYVNGTLVRDGYVNLGDVIELGDYRLTLNGELQK